MIASMVSPDATSDPSLLAGDVPFGVDEARAIPSLQAIYAEFYRAIWRTLLLFGVQPRIVFAPGWAVKSFLEVCGIHAPNAVGVASTVALWWLLFAALGLAWERRRRGSAT